MTFLSFLPLQRKSRRDEVSRLLSFPLSLSSASHLSEMKSGKRRCTPEYDLRLSRFFAMTPGFWMRLQLNYEMQRTSQKLGQRIIAEVQPAA